MAHEIEFERNTPVFHTSGIDRDMPSFIIRFGSSKKFDITLATKYPFYPALLVYLDDYTEDEENKSKLRYEYFDQSLETHIQKELEFGDLIAGVFQSWKNIDPAKRQQIVRFPGVDTNYARSALSIANSNNFDVNRFHKSNVVKYFDLDSGIITAGVYTSSTTKQQFLRTVSTADNTTFVLKQYALNDDMELLRDSGGNLVLHSDTIDLSDYYTSPVDWNLELAPITYKRYGWHFSADASKLLVQVSCRLSGSNEPPDHDVIETEVPSRNEAQTTALIDEKTVTGISNTNPCVITFSPALLPGNSYATAGAVVYLDSVVGTTEANYSTFYVLSSNEDTVTIDLDGTQVSPYVSGGRIYKMTGAASYTHPFRYKECFKQSVFFELDITQTNPGDLNKPQFTFDCDLLRHSGGMKVRYRNMLDPETAYTNPANVLLIYLYEISTICDLYHETYPTWFLESNQNYALAADYSYDNVLQWLVAVPDVSKLRVIFDDITGDNFTKFFDLYAEFPQGHSLPEFTGYVPVGPEKEFRHTTFNAASPASNPFLCGDSGFVSPSSGLNLKLMFEGKEVAREGLWAKFYNETPLNSRTDYIRRVGIGINFYYTGNVDTIHISFCALYWASIRDKVFVFYEVVSTTSSTANSTQFNDIPETKESYHRLRLARIDSEGAVHSHVLAESAKSSDNISYKHLYTTAKYLPDQGSYFPDPTNYPKRWLTTNWLIWPAISYVLGERQTRPNGGFEFLETYELADYSFARRAPFSNLLSIAATDYYKRALVSIDGYYASSFLKNRAFVDLRHRESTTSNFVDLYQYKFDFNGANAWQLDTEYTVGDKVRPTVPNGLRYVALENGRSSAILEPVWKTSIGSVTGDHEQRWQCESDGLPVWSKETKYYPWSWVRPTVANGYIYVVKTLSDDSKSGSTEPPWALEEAATVTDGNVIWWALPGEVPCSDGGCDECDCRVLVWPAGY